MDTNRFMRRLYVALIVPLLALTSIPVFGLAFASVQDSPDGILAYGALLVVWLVFVIEGLNRELGRSALPWLPMFEPFFPIGVRFAILFGAYAVFGFVIYKSIAEP